MTAEPDRVATLAPITDHVAAGTALLTQRWREKPRVVAILGAWLAQVQLLEDAFAELLLLTIDTASDDQLAQYGVILGAPKPGSVEKAVYRRILHAAALAIGASSTGDELLAVLDALADHDAGEVFSLAEYFPAALVVEPEEAVAVPTASLWRVLRRAVAAGVRLLAVDVPAGDTFAFSDTDETVSDANRGFSDEDGVVGGQLVGVIDA